MKRLACALVFAGCACVLLGASQGAQAVRARVSGEPHLSILTPDPAEIGDRVSVDVGFRGSAVESVELYLDHALVAKRQLSAPQTRGVISFTLDATVLAEGSHDITVKAIGPDGKASVSSAKLRIPGADLSAPVRIAYPQNGNLVSGIVSIRMSLDQQILRARPYVTFFVDKELMVLRNYPPYEYNWDTTRVANGWHMLEAWTQTDDAMGPTKARPVNVSVNNPGGETHRLTAIPDLRTPAAKPIVMKPELPPATAAVAHSVPGVVGKAGPGRTQPRPTAAIAGRLSQPSTLGQGTACAPAASPAVAAAAPARSQRPAARMAGGAISRPSGRLVIASAPKNVLPPLTRPDPVFAVIAPTRTMAGTLLMLVRPGDTLDSVSKRSGVSASELARLNNLKPSSRLKPGAKLIVPGAGSFQVAFNGQPIAFDVMPRVQDGMRLAPFRQIFEHTGGRLYWFGGPAQTVHAVNDTRDILIKIGDPKAKVNNEMVQMDRVPFIESGRTIVPLTFVRDALDVKVIYDAETGRLLLQSVK